MSNKSMIYRPLCSGLCRFMRAARTASFCLQQKVPGRNMSSATNSPGQGRRGISDDIADERVAKDIEDWHAGVNILRLNEDERKIHEAHVNAMHNKEETYVDPITGYTVFTRLTHLQRGKCCGGCCRHCPYKHANVPASYKAMKRWNTAFYV